MSFIPTFVSMVEKTRSVTDKERIVLEMLCKGYTDAQIANELELSINTIKTHLKSIYKKLKVANRTMAVVKWQQIKN